MSDESIGGFFVDLGIKTDGSIEKGIGQFEGLTNSVSRLIGTIRNVSAASFALATVTSTMETAELHAAELLNTNAETLSMWKIAASTATADSKGFISSLTNLEQKMQDLKFGKVDQGLAESLNRLNIGYQQLADMDLTQRVKLIFERATELKDQDQAERLIGQILGDSGMKMFNYMKLQGVSLNDLLLSAQQSVFTGTESKIKAMSFTSELNALKSSLKEISALTGSELGGIFEPLVEGINKFTQANHDLIQSGILDTFKKLKTSLDELNPTFKEISNSFVNLLNAVTDSKSLEESLSKITNSFIEFGSNITSTVFEATADSMEFLTALANGDFKGAARAYNDFMKNLNSNIVDTFDGYSSLEEQSIAMQKKMKETENLPDKKGTGIDIGGLFFNWFNEKMNNIDFSSDKINTEGINIPKSNPEDKSWLRHYSIDDGIVKPNGEVINISPDDWVFTMKDPSNLTGGISPESIKSLVSKTVGSIQNNVTENITVNQTFNITGTNNLPQTIKHQAQKGIYDGVGDLLQKSTTRLQLMSGIK